MHFNAKELRDKIEGCWIGKNIGGTMGGPFEGTHDILDINGYTTPKGEPLPNDDLDLQLVWLLAMEEVGPYSLNANDLAEYWLSYVVPHWNEYGIGKSNLRYGFMPPLCGAINNDDWKNSNGAWIRTEIWATLNPANPDAAVKYAFADACIDHGMGEGTYAAMFLAALESAAFVERDIRKLIEIGLSKIPQSSRTARAINLILKSYDDGVDWKTTRNLLVEDSKDLGWFEAPCNVAFALLGILYGEGDFKKSMILAINCGDDTDCTGATVGSILGIINGKSNIPSDWQEYIGEKIITISVNQGMNVLFPDTITNLTDRVLKLIPVCAIANKFDFNISNGDTQYEENVKERFYGTGVAQRLCNRSEYSFDVNLGFGTITVSYDKAPRLLPNESINVNFKILGRFWQIPENLSVRFITPEGFTVTGPKSIYMQHGHAHNNWYAVSEANYVVTAGEQTEAQNRIIVEILCPGRASQGLFELVILG